MTTDNICSMCGQSAPGGFPDFEKEIRIELRPFPDGEVICLACGGGDVETRVKSLLDRLKCDPDGEAFVLKLTNREVARAINKSFSDRGLDLQSLTDKDLASAFQTAVDALSTMDAIYEMAYALDAWEAERRLSPEEIRVKSILTRLGRDGWEQVYSITNLDVAIAVEEHLADEGLNPEDLEIKELSRLFDAAVDGVHTGDEWTAPMRYGIDAAESQREFEDDDEGGDQWPLLTK